MRSFEELSQLFAQRFTSDHFPSEPQTLYEPNRQFLQLGGKRVRPVLCLMGHELFDDVTAETWHLATAIELFHNFTLIHDDIMDQAPLRRGLPTVHAQYGANTAILAGDVMLIKSYEYLNHIGTPHLTPILHLFNQTAREVCEGQQLDMDFEKLEQVTINEYLRMIELKTSVLLAASLQMGAMLGEATQRNQDRIYEFGRKLGLAFQVQDDYLDAFGDPSKFGKQVGGDILANKKTFLLIHALESADKTQLAELRELLESNPEDKVERVLGLYRKTGVDAWALELKKRFLDESFAALDDIAVLSARKKPLTDLAHYLIDREQ
ncbi:MAG: polyprenyl synthetase family protein [Bacteroidota bacterium]